MDIHGLLLRWRKLGNLQYFLCALRLTVLFVEQALAEAPSLPYVIIAADDQHPEEHTDYWAFSPMDLKLLSKIEQGLYKDLVFVDEKTPDSNVKSWIKDYRDSYADVNISVSRSSVSSELATIVASHPFLTLRMIKRLSRLNFVLKNNQDLFGILERFGTDFRLPNRTDVEDVLRSILELQFLYDLNTDDLFQGKFGDIDTHVVLTLEEAYQIGSFAYESRFFPEALYWLQIVYTKIHQNIDGSAKLKKEAVFQLILQLTREHDNLISKIAQNQHHFSDHIHRFTNMISSKSSLKTVKEQEVQNFRKTQDRTSFPAYALLCAGEEFRNAKELSQLFCWLNRKSDWAWTISPLKMEVHSLDPYIFQVYDVIGEKTTATLLRSVQSQMEKTEKDSLNGLINISMLRSAVIDERNEKLGKLAQLLDMKIERITKLKVSNTGDPYFFASEQFKVTSYAFGGQFHPHLDAYGKRNPGKRGNAIDRLATFMIYLNDVQYGGYTVFPSLGIHVEPQKNSALFWNNLLKNGTPDNRVMHGACPVILGEKWITTKWIQLNANFQTRRCSLDRLQ